MCLKEAGNHQVRLPPNFRALWLTRPRDQFGQRQLCLLAAGNVGWLDQSHQGPQIGQDSQFYLEKIGTLI